MYLVNIYGLDILKHFSFGDFCLLGIVIIIITMLVQGSSRFFNMLVQGVLDLVSPMANERYESIELWINHQCDSFNAEVRVPNNILVSEVSLATIDHAIFECIEAEEKTGQSSVFLNCTLGNQFKTGFSVSPETINQAKLGKIKHITLKTQLLDQEKFIVLIATLWGWELVRQLEAMYEAEYHHWEPLKGLVNADTETLLLLQEIAARLSKQKQKKYSIAKTVEEIVKEIRKESVKER